MKRVRVLVVRDGDDGAYGGWERLMWLGRGSDGKAHGNKLEREKERDKSGKNIKIIRFFFPIQLSLLIPIFVSKFFHFSFWVMVKPFNALSLYGISPYHC
ncbi:hypothetical protein HYC85_032346 [Camellia sinensis]|uniref:Uncharacterized protein n=1 Tax=Camellia sinensis TaxID=4442 RepID=A0A7J7FSV5_CAMSI|nr:hypothetical protein HYC85_032346 [Camellia sinensis]